MAGFDNEPRKSEFHRYSSWGRTRRPKNVNGNSSTAQAETLAAAPAHDAAANITNSVSTENQRFLHLHLNTDTVGDEKTVTVHGFSYAMNRWAPLKDVRGNAVAITVNNGTAYQIFEIHGVDRLCFVRSGDIDEFYAATSTF